MSDTIDMTFKATNSTGTAAVEEVLHCNCFDRWNKDKHQSVWRSIKSIITGLDDIFLFLRFEWDEMQFGVSLNRLSRNFMACKSRLYNKSRAVIWMWRATLLFLGRWEGGGTPFSDGDSAETMKRIFVRKHKRKQFGLSKTYYWAFSIHCWIIPLWAVIGVKLVLEFKLFHEETHNCNDKMHKIQCHWRNSLEWLPSAECSESIEITYWQLEWPWTLGYESNQLLFKMNFLSFQMCLEVMEGGVGQMKMLVMLKGNVVTG